MQNRHGIPIGEKHICTLNVRSSLRKRRTCWLKFCGFFQDLILISEKNPRARLYYRSHTAINNEKWRQLTAKHTIIHPFSEFRRYFEYIMICIFLFHLILTPWDMYSDAIYATELGIGSHIYLSAAFIFNLADIATTFHTGYQEEHTDEVVIDIKAIRRHYLHGWLFFADVIATIPLELIIAHLPYTHAHHIRWINLLSVSRLFRLPTTIIYMNNVADLWQLNPALYRSLRYLVYAVLILHWSTCMSTVISKYFYIYNLGRTQQNWIKSAMLKQDTNLILIYISAMFRTAGQLLGVTHGIYPNLAMEDKLTTVVLFMTGYFLMGFLLILTLQLIMSHAGPHLMNLAFLNQLQMYMTRIRLPQGKQNKLTTYYKYLFRENSFYDSETLELLSDQLRHEIVMHTYRHLVKNITIMSEFPQESIDVMLKYMKREIYMPGDYVMKAGAPGNCMHFIVNGTVALITTAGIEVCHLHDGAYFGEIALICEGNKRTTSAIALEISEICRLERKHFNLSIDKSSPAFKRLMDQALARQKHLVELKSLHTAVMHGKKPEMQDHESASNTSLSAFSSLERA
ncbi:hypothetical protein Trydic_g19847 [Trypoxylus dichotomus]